MCGIIGYIGNRKSVQILINGLKTLEYRGYDSAGIAIFLNGKILVKKSVGQIKNLEKLLKNNLNSESYLGIGHTRWATHGMPNKINAHPHSDSTKRIFVVHNGIIENYKELKAYLQNRGHHFYSETDTEIIPNLIEDFLKDEKNFFVALSNAVKMIKGTYAIAIIDSKNPDILYATKFSSPLVIGIGNGENFLSSDISALTDNTKKVIYLNDGDIVKITKNNVEIININKQKVLPKVVSLKTDFKQVQKGNYSHFMLKEIFEGPEIVRSTLKRLMKNDKIKLNDFEKISNKLKKTKRLIILSCGTSYYAGLISEYFFEEIAKIPTEVHIASEFRYREDSFENDVAVIAISQSGETADTLAAIRKMKDKGLFTIGITNTEGSSITMETDATIYNHSGPEIGVAATKTLISQLTILFLIAISLLKDNKKNNIKNLLLKEIKNIPWKMEIILKQSFKLKKFAEKYKNFNNFLFLGRRYNYPVALEGALKLKEVSYIHAEGCSAGEMKHGTIALINEKFPTLAIITQNSIYEKMFSNLEEIKARKGLMFLIGNNNDKKITSLTNDIFFIPKTIEPLEPFLTILSLQLFAYYSGIKRGFDVDKPRNLAKSVTVE